MVCSLVLVDLNVRFFRPQSTEFRNDPPDRLSEQLVKSRVDWTMPDGRTGGIDLKAITIIPIVLGPDWPRAKSAAAIRTDVLQNIFDAGTAVSAFEAANHSIC